MKPSPRPLDWYDAKTEPPTEADEDDDGQVKAHHVVRGVIEYWLGSYVRDCPGQFDKWCPHPKLPPYPEETPEPEDKPAVNGWHPINGPEDCPTEADGRTFYITTECLGGVHRVSTSGCDWIRLNWERLKIRAWQVESIPDPYMPPEPGCQPEPEDEGERREWTGVVGVHIADGVRIVAYDYPEELHVREVKPGDPIQEAGVNGISNEALMAIVEHRLQGFQSGNYACRENAVALTKLQESMMWLQKRTRDRMARGVEGTSEK